MQIMTMNFSRGQDIIERDFQGESVLLDLNTGLYFSLNSVGSFVWRLLDGSRTARDIAEHLSANYDVDPDTAARDTEELIRDLLDQRLIQTAASAEANNL